MTETVEGAGEQLTPESAVQTIEEARGYEEPLRRRTEGVTWMIWGLVAAGIQLSFSALSSLFRPYTPPGVKASEGLAGTLVVPVWVVLGILLTVAAWRIASLKASDLSVRPSRVALGALVFVGVLYGVWFLLDLAGLPEAIFPVLAIGAAWLSAGLSGILGTTEMGRGTLVAIGALVVLLGLGALAAFTVGGLAPNGRLTYDVTAPVTLLVAGGVPFLAGLWQSWTG